MAEYKFMDYQKTDGDTHITRRLEEEHHGNIPDVVTDKQLRPGYAKTENSSIEARLEKTRLGGADMLIEKNLNDSKNQFGSNHRDASTYEGNISKLEEKRIKDYNIEGEKYEPASETPKDKRWWEVKSDDGLVIASIKTAQVDDYTLNQMDLDRDGDWDLDRTEDLNDWDLDDMEEDDTVPFSDDFDIDEVDDNFGLLKEISFDPNKDVGGTPTAVGALELTGSEGVNLDPNDIEEELRDYMESKDLRFSMDSFDFSQIDKGIVTFSIVNEGGSFEINEVEASANFPIVTAKKKIDDNKINQAFDSFKMSFDEDNIPAIHDELNSLLIACNFTEIEKQLFLRKVRIFVGSTGINLDLLS